MNCLYNSVTNEERFSELYKDLLKVVPSIDQADEIFAYTQTNAFKQQFGDWVNQYDKNEKVNYNVYETTGEPKIYKDLLGNYHFKGIDGKKIRVDRKVLDFDYVVRKSLVDTTMVQLFGNTLVTDFDLIDSIDLNQIFNDKSPNSIHSILDGNLVDLQDVKVLVQERLKQIGITTLEEREDFDNSEDNDTEYSDIENTGDTLNIISSLEKNSKDTASANIKFLMNFVPEMEFSENGNSIVQRQRKVKLSDGSEYVYNSYYDFDHIWNVVEQTLANTIDLYNGGKVVSKFNVMIERLQEQHSHNASIIYLVNELKKLPEWKRQQFVQAFDKIKVTYNSSLLQINGENFTFKVTDSSKAITPEKETINKWNASFGKSKLLDDKGNFKLGIAQGLRNNFNNFVEELRKNSDNINFSEENLVRLNGFLKYVGINVSRDALAEYIENTGTDETNENTDLYNAGNKLKLLFGDTVNKNVKGLADLIPTEVSTSDGLANVFGNQKVSSQINELARLEVKYGRNLAESNIKGAKNKSYWLFSMPTYIHNRTARLKQDPESELPRQSGFYRKSTILDKFRDPENNQAFIDEFDITTFNNIRQEFVGDEGDDNKSITQADQAMDMINKTLLGILPGETSFAYTLTPADKGTMHHMTGIENFWNTLKDDSNLNDEVLTTFVDYYINELERMKEEFTFIQDTENIKKNPNQYYKDKHFKLKDNTPMFYAYMENGKEVLTNESIVEDKKVYPVGNAFKSALFPGLSPFTSSNELVNKIFNTTTGQLLLSHEEIINNPDIRQFINSDIIQIIELNKLEIQSLKMMSENGNVKSIDSRILNEYKKFVGNDKKLASDRAIADFVVNSMINNIEYAMVYTGDWANFKNLSDFSKRIPGTYTDGTQVTLKEGDNPNFTLAVLPNITLPSKTLTEIAAFSPSMAKAYENINVTDAQGWITLDRWKFLMERTNHWTPKYEAAFKKIQDGTAGAEEYKMAAQPIKGVHFEVVTGVSTYVKYSAAVLVPSVIKGTKLEQLNNMMQEQGIDEAVVIDGIKAGATIPSDILNEDQSLKQGNFNTITLRNNNYKVQQDLRPKGVKQTLMASQIKKVALLNFDTTKEWGGYTGEYVKQHVNDLLSDLSNRGLKDLADNVGIDSNGKVVNKEKLTAKIIGSLSERGASENLIEALQKEYDYDVVANYRQKIQNSVMSIINNATIKYKTNGASFIQMSAWSFDDITDAKNSGVKLLLDEKKFKGLQAPQVYTDENGIKKVKPGQVFVTSNYISKFIPNWKNIPTKDLKKMIDSRMLKMIGYRIPNQGMSSNDSLEIVGILPESMGDTIVPYIDITTKTGSDFDIDKMYVMIPNGEWKRNKLRYVEYNSGISPDKNSKEAVENRLIEMLQVIFEDDKTYEQLMTPLDSNKLKDDVKFLHGNKDTGDIGSNYFSPMYQLQKKFDNSGGKSGVGLIANQLVDHTFTQMAKMTYNEDLGFVNLDTNNNTSFYGEYDILGENRISETLSWFLTAYVDIAKDPYITDGNHNQYTSNAGSMLIRAGAPYKFVNRLLGQQVVKDMAITSVLRQSRQKEVDYRSLKDAVIEDSDLQSIEGNSPRTALEIMTSLRNSDNRLELLSKLEEQMEKDIKNPSDSTYWKKRQREYLNLYEYFHNIGENFAKTVLSSKQDVNGGGKDSISAQVNFNRVEEAKTLGFDGYERKFQNTFLGTAYENSTVLSMQVMGQLFVTANQSAQAIYNEVQKLVNPNREYLLDEKLGFELEKSYFAHILGQEAFNLPTNKIQEMFLGENTLYDRLIELRKLDEVQENYFLDKLNVDRKDGMKFLKMDSTRNNSKEALDEISRSWNELLLSDNPTVAQFGKDLIYYAYYNSGFRTNISSFFEHTPTDILAEMTQGSIADAKLNYAGGITGANNFIDKFFRNNWENDSIIPVVSSRQLKKGLLTLPKLLDTGTENGKFSRPYVKVKSTDQMGNSITKLFKHIGYLVDTEGKATEAKFVEVPKLGYTKAGNNIKEYNSSIKVNGDSIIASNNLLGNRKQLSLDAYNIITKLPNYVPYRGLQEMTTNLKASAVNNRNQDNDFKEGLDEDLITPINC